MRRRRYYVLGLLLLVPALALSVLLMRPRPPQQPTGDPGAPATPPAPVTESPDPAPGTLPLLPLPGVARRPVTVMVLGVDEGELRSDVVLVVHWNPSAHTLAAVSVPRDSRVPIPCRSNMPACKSPDKLAHAYAYGAVKGDGPSLARDTLEGFLGVRIDHYVVVNFSGFEQAIDQLGGVTLNVEPGMEDIKLQPGLQHLDGKQALRYVRFRSDGQGDIGRIKRTQKFLAALLSSAGHGSGTDDLPGAVRSILSAVKTDLDTASALELALAGRTLDAADLRTVSLPGTPLMLDGLWFWDVDAAEKDRIVHEYLTDPMGG